MGPSWTIDEALDLTFPRLIWLQNKGKFPKAAVASDEVEAMRMLRQYAQEQGIPFDA